MMLFPILKKILKNRNFENSKKFKKILILRSRQSIKKLSQNILEGHNFDSAHRDKSNGANGKSTTNIQKVMNKSVKSTLYALIYAFAYLYIPLVSA